MKASTASQLLALDLFESLCTITRQLHIWAPNQYIYLVPSSHHIGHTLEARARHFLVTLPALVWSSLEPDLPASY